MSVGLCRMFTDVIVLVMTDLMNVSGMSAQASNKCMQQACRCRQNSSPPPLLRHDRRNH